MNECFGLSDLVSRALFAGRFVAQNKGAVELSIQYANSAVWKTAHLSNSIAEFDSTRGVYRFGDLYECRRTNEILLRKFLAALERPAQMTNARHKTLETWPLEAKAKNLAPAFSPFSLHEVFDLHSSKYIRKIGKYLISAKIFGWKSHEAVKRHVVAYRWPTDLHGTELPDICRMNELFRRIGINYLNMRLSELNKRARGKFTGLGCKQRFHTTQQIHSGSTGCIL